MSRMQRRWTVAGMLSGALILVCYFLNFATLPESMTQQWRLVIPLRMESSSTRVVMGADRRSLNQFSGTFAEAQIAEILGTKAPPPGFYLLAVDYALNPQTGDALHLNGNAWQPVARSNVVAEEHYGAWRIFDGRSWAPFSSPFLRYESGVYVRPGRDVKVAVLLGVALPIVLVCVSGLVAWGGRKIQ